MPLVYLLYRCPRCGHDPLEGKGDEARCGSCGTHFARGGPGGRLEVTEADGKTFRVPAPLLSAAVRHWEEGDDRGSEGMEPRRSAVVRVRWARQESPVRYRGELLGFVESAGEPTQGILELVPDALLLTEVVLPGATPAAGRRERWPLLSIAAVQTASSSLQIAPQEGGVVEFRFQEDSPQRWELLLHRALRRSYREAGRGEILEFQPRIRTR